MKRDRRTVLLALIAGCSARVFAGSIFAMLGVATVRDAAAQSDDQLVVVRVSTRDVRALQEFIRENRIEVVRVMLPTARDPDAVATLLMRRGILVRARSIPSFRIVVLEEAPKTRTDLPPVGRGDRFRDPNSLPEGTGRLVPR